MEKSSFPGKEISVVRFLLIDGQNERELRMKNDDIMSAEEFFGEVEKDKAPVRMGKARGKGSKTDLFAELKVKMVMRIYGVSKKRALEIIAGRAAEKRALESGNGNDGRASGKDEGGFMSAKEFFGEVDE